MPDSELDSELLMRCAIKLQSFLSSQSDQETILAGTPIAVTPSGISSCSPRDEISVLELFLLKGFERSLKSPKVCLTVH